MTSLTVLNTVCMLPSDPSRRELELHVWLQGARRRGRMSGPVAAPPPPAGAGRRRQGRCTRAEARAGAAGTGRPRGVPRPTSDWPPTAVLPLYPLHPPPDFAWTEADVPRKLAARPLARGHPLFCVETALKLLTWSW